VAITSGLILSFVTIVAEVPCDDNNPATKTSYEEAKTILEFCPDRLGHALLLPPTLQQILFAAKIPVESCPTSNVMTLELAKHCSGSLLEGLKQHPQLKTWLQKKHPISIGTDDPGVFHTNATKELMLLQKAFNVDKDGLERIVIQSMDHAFCDSETKKLVQRRIKDRLC
jgi:adenosine deaminase